MKINCLIIDDEPLAIQVIENHLGEFSDFNIVAKLNDPVAAISSLQNNKIDVIFLDINMPKMSGLEFIKTFKTPPLIIITTAYREYAVESYELFVLDYLIKPIPFNRFLKTINKITQQIDIIRANVKLEGNQQDSFIFLKVEKKLIKVKFDDILYIESLKDYIKVVTLDNNYLVHKSLSSITEELPTTMFLRIHRSYTVAIDKISSLEGNLVEVSTKKIPIGRKYVNHAKQIILKSE
jgi:DNA-binding LytR/AlgR family response regulator